MNYPIQIYKVQSRDTGIQYHLASPSADTDMATDGLLLLASIHHSEIQLFNASSDEYPLGPVEGSRLRADRENERQARVDLVRIALDLSEPSQNSTSCDYAFHDLVGNGHADPVSEIETNDYLNGGGKIVDKRNESAR